MGMMPESIGPMTFVFTGSGNVSQGAQEIFQELPHEYVTPSMLKKVAEHGATNKLYACEVKSQHLPIFLGIEKCPVKINQSLYRSLPFKKFR